MPAPDPGTALRQVASELTRLGKRFAIVGGFGVSLRAEVRFTRDVDLAVSMDARRLQDRIDAVRLLEVNPDLDVPRVRDDLRLIETRGFSRRQDLGAKLDDVLESVRLELSP